MLRNILLNSAFLTLISHNKIFKNEAHVIVINNCKLSKLLKVKLYKKKNVFYAYENQQMLMLVPLTQNICSYLILMLWSICFFFYLFGQLSEKFVQVSNGIGRYLVKRKIVEATVEYKSLLKRNKINY